MHHVFETRRVCNVANVEQQPVQNLFPVILSILGERSSYNHVVVVWKQMVIDFENERTSALTMETIDNIAGINNRFHKFGRGYGILPSKAMKRAVNDWTDWGEQDMHGDLRYLFKKGK